MILKFVLQPDIVILRLPLFGQNVPSLFNQLCWEPGDDAWEGKVAIIALVTLPHSSSHSSTTKTYRSTYLCIVLLPNLHDQSSHGNEIAEWSTE